MFHHKIKQGEKVENTMRSVVFWTNFQEIKYFVECLILPLKWSDFRKRDEECNDEEFGPTDFQTLMKH